MASINGVLMQAFHWYFPTGGVLWNQLKESAADLANAGFTALWLPPAYKGQGGGYDVGYGVYDLFDLGEFDQKGGVPTKYGDRDQYLSALKTLKSVGIEVYADVVLNHKDGGDYTEKVLATPFNRYNRTQPSGDVEEIEIYSGFNFPNRQHKYSSMEWHWRHFDAVNYNHYKPNDRDTVYLLKGKSFDNFVSLEKGNYDFLLGCDLDMDHEEVRQELMYWGRWYLDTTGVDGFRLDAIKHIPSWFFVQWLDHLRHHAQRDLFCVGEYWTTNTETLHWYLEATDGKMSLFDTPLQNNFHQASRSGGTYDMRGILDGSLVQHQPALAVTLVENHDTQPLQSLENVVESWFKPLAYAIILLRREGYPCVFYADYYGAHYKDKGYEIWLDSHRWIIDKLLDARKHYAHGDQYDYFDHWDIIGWTRLGNSEHPKALAVIMSNGPGGGKWMEIGKRNAQFVDLTEHISEPIYTNDDCWGEFRCNGGSVSVWVEQ